MCGLHGSVAGVELGPEALAHRGPDEYGTYRDGAVVLEHWRLSIIDLSANGRQPMASSSGRFVIAYNGEVYNFEQLRGRLPDVDFRSRTDTEVVLELYARYGAASFEWLNGMFALAIYDKEARRMVLARDRFGIKPLYYRIGASGALAFASELRALLAGHDVEPALDLAAIRSLFHLLYIEGERTPFEGVRKLAPGHYLVYDLDTKEVTLSRYHEFRPAPHGLPEEQCVESIDSLLSESVRMHLVSDVPVGALLSGGLDSSLIVAMMKKYADEVHTFSVGYSDNKLFDESKYASLVAAQYGTAHHHAVVDEKTIASLVDRVCAVMDEPTGDTSVFLNFFIFGYVAESVKVCLSGLGGDELFGGYNRYVACHILPLYHKVPRALRKAVLATIDLLPASRAHALTNKIRLVKTFLRSAEGDLGSAYARFIDYLVDADDSPVLGTDRFTNARFDAYWDEALLSELNRIYKYDIENYMVNDLLLLTDRMSMQHSLEARVPYLENALVELALQIPPERKIRGLKRKRLLSEVARRYLPSEVLDRRKQGFSSPLDAFLTSARIDAIAEELNERNEPYVEILNRPLFKELIAKHRSGRNDCSLQIFTLYVYLRWMDSCFAGIAAGRRESFPLRAEGGQA